MKTLIKLFFFIAIVLNIACSDDGSNTVIITDPNPKPPIIAPEPPADAKDVQVVLYTAASTKFYDGETVWEWQNGNVKKAYSKVYSHENIIYKLDNVGAATETRQLVIEPDSITIDPVAPAIVKKGPQTEIDLGLSDMWIIENLTPQEAFDLGAQFKDYTRIYLNADESGQWFTRDYFLAKLVLHNNDIWGQKSTGAWINVNGTKEDIRIVIEDGFAVWNYDANAKTAIIDDINVSWTTNFFNGANYWLKSGSKWYSQNGYTWDGAALIENGSVMTNWRMPPYDTGYNEAPVIISVGTHFENGEDVLYFIECNSGHVIRYVPSVNQYVLSVRLYTGDGFRTTGLYYQKLLKPNITGDYLYFIFDAQVYRYNFVTGLTSHFIGGVSEVWSY